MSFVVGFLLSVSITCNACVLLTLSARGVCDKLLRKLGSRPILTDMRAAHTQKRWRLPYLFTEFVVTSTIVVTAVTAVITSGATANPFVNPTKHDDNLELSDILIAAVAVFYAFRIFDGVTTRSNYKFKMALFDTIAVVCYVSFGALRENRLLVISSTFALIVRLSVDAGWFLSRLPSCNTHSTRRKSYVTTLVLICLQIIAMTFCLVYGLAKQNPLDTTIPSRVAFFFGMLYYTVGTTWLFIYYVTKLYRKPVKIETVSATKAFLPLINRHDEVVRKPLSVSFLLEKDQELLRPFSNRNIFNDQDQRNNQKRKDINKIPNELLNMIDNQHSGV